MRRAPAKRATAPRRSAHGRDPADLLVGGPVAQGKTRDAGQVESFTGGRKDAVPPEVAEIRSLFAGKWLLRLALDRAVKRPMQRQAEPLPPAQVAIL